MYHHKSAATQMSHCLRTGQRVTGFDPNGYKSSNILSAVIIKRVLREPDRSLVIHYFFSRGTFDRVKRELLLEADSHCDRPREDYIMGRAKSIERFQRNFSDNQPVDFTNEFFSLGNSFLEMDVTANAEVNCINKGVSITGNIRYEINDWFRDVLDIADKIPGYQEAPFGTAFKMVARWSDNFDLSGSFR